MKMIIDITLVNKEGLGMLRDYLDDNNLSYEVKSVEETTSSVASALKAGDIVTVVGNSATLSTGKHYIEIGEVCRVVNLFSPITGAIEVSPLDNGGFTQIVYQGDLLLGRRRLTKTEDDGV
jgi:hypothetical protein